MNTLPNDENDWPTLAVSNWSETFETADSRRHKALQWISVPVSFNSTGFQRLLDDFEPAEAAAIYGTWHALLRIAATANVRGILAGQKGERYTLKRLERLSGFPADLFGKLCRWAFSVGWLVVNQSSIELPNLTQPNPTLPDKTGPDRTGPDTTTSPEPSRTGRSLRTSKTESIHGPGFKLTERAEALRNASPWENAQAREPLAELFLRPVRPEPERITGSAFDACVEKSLCRPECWNQKRPTWPILWYKQQLAAPEPVLTAANCAELALTIAAAITVSRMPAKTIRSSRWAVWAAIVQRQDVRRITAEDIATAAEIVRDILQATTPTAAATR